MSESRVKKSFQNAKVNVFFYLITLFLSFFSRKIFLERLGADFIGLTGTLQNLLGFLNLADLGIGASMGYILYKPLFEKNQEKLREIISVLGYLYRYVGLFILIAGGILALFLPLIFEDTSIGIGVVYFAYFSFLVSSLIGYFINYRQFLLGCGPAELRGYGLLADGESGEDLVADGIGLLCRQLLSVDSGRIGFWYPIFGHIELEDQSSISVVEVQCRSREGEIP